jgi:hypothetical protein
VFIRPGRPERPAGREGGAKTTELGSQHGPPAAGDLVQEGTVIPARPSRAASRPSRSVLLAIGLATVARVLRTRRFDEQVAVAVIMLAALAQLGRKVLARVVRELIAWDNARLADLEEQLRRRHMAQAPGAAVLEVTVIQARRPTVSSRERTVAWLGVGLAAAARTLRSYRFDEQVIVALIVRAALAQMGKTELVRVARDLIAWDNARLADLEKKLRRQRQAKAGQGPRPASRSG